MPSIKIHCAISKKRTGEPYSKLHNWIDEKKGINHRQERHYYTTKLKNYVKDNFGGTQAVSEWLFHLALDNVSTYLKNENDYAGKKLNNVDFTILDNGFVYHEVGFNNDEDIKMIYGTDEEIEKWIEEDGLEFD